MTVTPHQQIPLTQWKLPEKPINFPKHKEKEERTRRRTINADLILCEIDSHDNPPTLPQVYPLQNVVNGRAANKNVYSHNCLKICTKLMKSFTCSLPLGLYASFKTKLVSLEVLKKGVKLGELTAFDYGFLLQAHNPYWSEIISCPRPVHELPPLLFNMRILDRGPNHHWWQSLLFTSHINLFQM